jgi:dipeptidyl aminopeptidase/acylaminoacyl peptidase
MSQDQKPFLRATARFTHFGRFRGHAGHVILATLLTLVTATAALAQDGAANGAIVARETVAFTPEQRQYFAERGRARGAVIDLDRVVIQRITYLSDGLRVRGYLVEPAAGDSLPAVIFNRGGNRDYGAVSDTFAVLNLGALAQAGYVVAASQYRGNAGGEGIEEFGGADVNDVLNLIPLLEGHPRVDASRLGMYGWSRGGMMTYLALARTDRIRAAVVGSGMADAFDMVARRPEMEAGVFAELVPNWAADREAQLAAHSAVRWPEKLNKATPILILHGSADVRVNAREALSMAEALYEVRHPYRFILFEGGDHPLSAFRSEVNRAVIEWFDRYVRDKAPLPKLEPLGP